MILAAGLSPAWQQILRFDRFTPGEVNRAAESHWCASGKVLNVGIALHHLGSQCLTLSTVGGETGRCIQREFETTGIPARWIETDPPTRVCTTILDNATGASTELVENTADVSETELKEFTTAFQEEAAQATTIIVSGSIPAGTPKTLWHDLLQPHMEKQILLDIRGDDLTAALSCRPFLIKPNREELERTVGRDLSSDTALVEAMHEFNNRGAEWVVVTDGPRAVWMTKAHETFRLQPPEIAVVNPIGSGDCLTAGISWGLQQKKTPVESVQLGMAAAVENATQLLPGRLDPQKVAARSQSIRCEAV